MCIRWDDVLGDGNDVKLEITGDDDETDEMTEQEDRCRPPPMLSSCPPHIKILSTSSAVIPGMLYTIIVIKTSCKQHRMSGVSDYFCYIILDICQLMCTLYYLDFSKIPGQKVTILSYIATEGILISVSTHHSVRNFRFCQS